MYSSTLSPISKTSAKTSSLIVQKSMPPVIVVGLPRSGSSYLSHVLSCMDDWFIFDDLYPYQKAASLGISRTTNLAKKPAMLTEYVSKLTWQLRAKIKFEENFQIPNLNLDDADAMERSLLEALVKNKAAKDGETVNRPGSQSTQTSLTWPQVLEEWTTRLAHHSGKSHWGYKTPQDFMHMDELTDIFPGVRFIYILRDPRKVLRSFKNLPRVKTSGTEDGESRQYHPLVYSLYWKTAYDKIQDFSSRNRAPVEMVRFEDLVKTPEAVAQQLADFLQTKVTGNVIPESFNSSFKVGARAELTGTEVAICEKIAGPQMLSAGYSLSKPSPQLSDTLDLAKTSADFVAYQLYRAFTNPRARTSITAFMKNLGQ